MSAMVFSGGALDPGSVRHETRTRNMNDLDTNAQKALADATKLIAKEARSYEIRQHPYAH